MSISARTAKTGTALSPPAGPYTITLPTGTAVGDYILIQFIVYSNSASQGAITASGSVGTSGRAMTVHSTGGTTGVGTQEAVLGFQVQAGDSTTTCTVNAQASGLSYSWAAEAYTGGNQSTPVDATTVVANGATTNAITTTTATAKLVACFGGTWSSGTLALPAGFTSRASLVGSGSFPSLRMCDKDGGAAGNQGTFASTGATVATVVALNATTVPLAPTLTAPSNASAADLASAGATFSAGYNAGTGGTGVTAYALRRKISGAGSYEYWNAGTSAWQSTIVWNTAASMSVVFAAAKWTNGNVYNWSFAAQDNIGQGPFASDFTVTAQNPPTVAVTAPTGSGAPTTPTYTWTDTLASGASQTKYRVVVEHGAYGTTPGSGTTDWDSGLVTSSSTSVAHGGAALAQGTSYRVFVQVTETGGQTSAWAFSTFTTVVTPPGQPTLTATPDNPNARVQLTVTAGAAPAGNIFVIQRSLDGGTTWADVRGATSAGQELAHAASQTIYDYEATPAAAAQYRAADVNVSAAGLTYSAWSATHTATMATTDVWLKDPLHPSVNRTVIVSGLDKLTHQVNLARHDPLPNSDGSVTYPIPVWGAQRGVTGPIEFRTRSQAEKQAIIALLTSRTTLLVQTPADALGETGAQYYLAVGDVDETRPFTGPTTQRRLPATVFEVDAP
jgi:hypothetical protein